jgi:cobyrinic acid a,c-diamide synthase
MVGAIPGDAVMHERPVGRGYVKLEPTANGLWPDAPAGAPRELRGHEFHHSSLDNLDPGVKFAYRVTRGHGIDGVHDGLVHRNLLASYAHLRSVNANGWAGRFVAFVRAQRLASARQARRADRLDERRDRVVAA